MVTISKPLTSGKAQTYYEQEYAVASNNYFTQGQTLAGQVHGPLAQTLGLSGEITPEQFSRIMEGQHPMTGEQLIRHKDTVKTRDGQELGHRAGWDVTINASKSVSITALVGQDAGVREAWWRAEQKAIEWGTQFIQARTGAHTPAETTAKALWISFEHTTARPVDGYSAQHLHGHHILANMTLDSTGKWRSLQTSELFRIQKAMQAIAHSEIGQYLVSRGFEVERGKGHAVEIKGYSQEYLEAESPRSKQIKEALAEWERKTGRKPDTETYKQLVKQIREDKQQLPAYEQLAAWQAKAEQYGNQHQQVIHDASLRQHRGFTEPEIQAKTETAVSHAIASLSERNAVFDHYQLVQIALNHNLATNVDRIEAEISRRQRNGDLIAVDHVRPNAPLHRFTTSEMIRMEREVIERVLAGQNQEYATAPIRQADIRRYPNLNLDQQQALKQALLSHDQVFGIQGKPGVGKSFPLASIKELAEQHGYQVRGLGPTSQATKGLRQAQIDSRTLQMHLTRPPEPSPKPTLYFLDESSLASTKQMRDFLRIMQPQDRALLIGDTGQHGSVEAGRIFAELQEAGLRVVKLDKILRQKEPWLLKAVELATDGRIGEALKTLQENGRIHQIPNRDDRLKTMARDFTATHASTLALTPDNLAKQDLSAATRTELRKTGQMHGESHEHRILLTRQEVTGADRKLAASYNPGDVIRYQKGSREKGIKAKSYAEVIASDAERNLITIRQGSQYQQYDPAKLKGVSVYQPATREFAVGDRIQFLQKWDDKGVSTRDLGTISHLDKYGNIRVTLDESNRTVSWNINDYRHIDYGYSMTSYSSQSATVDRSLIHIDTGDPRLRAAVDQTMFRVALSRPRYDAHIYTDSIADLEKTLSRTTENTQALSPQQVSEYRQQTQQPTAYTERAVDQSRSQQPKGVEHAQMAIGF
jgi:conjugative relaxase-like TrwC/TraI family protein